MEKEIKKILKILEHTTSIEKAIEILESIEDEMLYPLLLETSHNYIIDGCSRGYIGAIVRLSFKHCVELYTGTGLISIDDIGGEKKSYYIDDGFQRKIDRVMDDMFLSEDDVDLE